MSVPAGTYVGVNGKWLNNGAYYAPTSATLSIWPDATNTGVPSGTTLTTYTGSGGFQNSTVVTIDKKIINEDIRVFDSAQITITNSIIYGHIDCDSVNASITLIDCEVDAGTWSNAAIGFQNLTLLRVNVHGGITAINASVNCNIQDCWLYGQYVMPGSNWHTGGFLCSGGNNILVKHCSIVCDTQNNGYGGGPSNSVNLFGDLAPLTNITFDHTLIRATVGGYEASFGWNPGKPYGDNPTYIIVKNCVFEHGPGGGPGGAYGTITSFKDSEPTNSWLNNTWDDGTPIPSDI